MPHHGTPAPPAGQQCIGLARENQGPSEFPGPGPGTPGSQWVLRTGQGSGLDLGPGSRNSSCWSFRPIFVTGRTAPGTEVVPSHGVGYTGAWPNDLTNVVFGSAHQHRESSPTRRRHVKRRLRLAFRRPAQVLDLTRAPGSYLPLWMGTAVSLWADKVPPNRDADSIECSNIKPP